MHEASKLLISVYFALRKNRADYGTLGQYKIYLPINACISKESQKQTDN
jgi:hypothetical protein